MLYRQRADKILTMTTSINILYDDRMMDSIFDPFTSPTFYSKSAFARDGCEATRKCGVGETTH